MYYIPLVNIRELEIRSVNCLLLEAHVRMCHCLHLKGHVLRLLMIAWYLHILVFQ